MRVWYISERRGQDPGGLESVLSQLAGRREGGLTLLHEGPFTPETPAQLRNRCPDVVVLHEPACFDNPDLCEVLNLDRGVVLAVSAERVASCRPLAEVHPIVFVSPRPTADGLWLALVSAQAAQRRFASWKDEIHRLQQRLTDRIVIERAKGVLVQRLRITEDEAYRRLRMLSRRQRRQIRDIAQSLLDTECLLLPEGTGCHGHDSPELPGVLAEVRDAVG